MGTVAEMEVRLLLRIVFQLLLASCTLSARLQWKSTPYHYYYMTIGQPSHYSVETPSDYIPARQPSSPSVILLKTTKRLLFSSTSCSCSSTNSGSTNYASSSSTYNGSGPASSSCSSFCSSNSTHSPIVQPPSPSLLVSPPPPNDQRSTSTIVQPSTPSPLLPPSPLPSNQRSNSTIVQPSSSPSHSPSLSPSPLPKSANISVSAGASRGSLDILGKIGIAIAVTLVLLVIFIAVFKKAFNAQRGNDSVRDSIDIVTHTTGQLANPGGNSLELDIIDLWTNTVEVGIDIRTYTMEELANATDNFTTKVGQGASGFVYRAQLPGNKLGAVKRATNLDPNLFKQELSVLLRLPRHPHLVDLIGLCLQPGERILVFEFISNGSLYDRLHKNNGLTSPLRWAARMDIAFQVAVALQYLHEEAKPPILHRDVKSANVLLEDDSCAKMADFGLSKLGPKDNQFTFTAVRGTYGYIDPEYMKTRRYSAKSDVYSFGVLLLELITGLKALHEDTPLAEWTQTYRSEGIDKFMTIVDGNMQDQANMMELQIMIQIANLCLRDTSEERSSMREIVNMMKESRNIKANGKLSDGDEAPFLANGNLSDGDRFYITVT